MKKYSIWSIEEIDYLKSKYQECTTLQMAQKLGRTVAATKSKIRQLGLVRDHNSIRKFCKRPNPGQFTKGCKANNECPYYTISVRNETDFKKGNFRQSKYIKVPKKGWVLYNRWLWEQHHGPIPAKHCIRHKDGDALNVVIDNLECISMAENARRNRNPSKAASSHKLRIEEGHLTTSQKLTDEYVAAMIVKSDKDLRTELIKAHPELIELKRTELLIKRKIKNYGKETR